MPSKKYFTNTTKPIIYWYELPMPGTDLIIQGKFEIIYPSIIMKVQKYLH